LLIRLRFSDTERYACFYPTYRLVPKVGIQYSGGVRIITKWTLMNAIKPIKTEADYDATLAEINTLMDAEPDTPEGDRLDILVTLVEAYEAKYWRIDPPDPIEAIKLRMQQRGLSRRDLEKVLGSKSRVSEVLNRQRPLTLAMIRRLHTTLGIPAESLIQPTTRKQRTKNKVAQAA
jgi:HTH-type transcriptional regulator/antitoxin HigA